MIPDFFVHLTSDMMTEKETKRLNNGDTDLVVTTPRTSCNISTSDCHIYLWFPSNFSCHFKNIPYLNDVQQFSVFASQYTGVRIARYQKLIRYKMIGHHYDHSTNRHVMDKNSHLIQTGCNFNKLTKLEKLMSTSFPFDSSRSFKVESMYCKFLYSICCLLFF